MRLRALLLGLLLCACDLAPTPGPEETDPGAPTHEVVVLRARHPDGVPLHAEERGTRMTGRLADGSEVEVLRWGAGRRWLEVRSPVSSGWITARYVSDVPPRAAALPLDDASAHAPGAWRSPETCARGRYTPRSTIGTWNLRWFPDGGPDGPTERSTDVAWMACAIASTGVAAIAVQEVLLGGDHDDAVRRLLAALDDRTGGRWESAFDRCPRDGRQHVGLLWDSERATVSSVRTREEVNPLRGACTGRLRPGLSATVRLGEAAPLEVTVVHLDSGVERRDLEHRRASLTELVASAGPRALWLGDFNAMGCGRCDVTGDQERAELDRVAAAAGLRRLEADVDCTEYYRGRGQTLDLAIAGRDVRGTAEVVGPCRTHGCRLPRGVSPPAQRSLSDHCPVVFAVR